MNQSPVSEQVGANIRAELARRRLTQADLAAALRIGRPTVSEKLAGKSRFTIDEVAAAAGLFGVEIGALVEGGATVAAE